MSLSWEMNQFKHRTTIFQFSNAVCYVTWLTGHVESADPYIPCGSYAGKAKCSTLQRLGPTTEIRTLILIHNILFL